MGCGIMPAISFSGETYRGPFWKQILEGKKTQTCRKPRKRPIRPGDIVTLYWKQRTPAHLKPIHKIARAQITKVERKRYEEFAFDNEFARKDGFEDCLELQSWFGDPSIEYGHGDDEYDVIHFRVFKKFPPS